MIFYHVKHSELLPVWNVEMLDSLIDRLTDSKDKWSVFPSLCDSRPLMEPLLPTLLIVLRGVLVFGVVEVIRLLSTSQWSRVFLAGLSCSTYERPDKRQTKKVPLTVTWALCCVFLFTLVRHSAPEFSCVCSKQSTTLISDVWNKWRLHYTLKSRLFSLVYNGLKPFLI